MSKILIVDDEADIRNLISDILTDEGYQTIPANNAATAFKAAEDEDLSLVILDIWLEGSEFDGIGILKRLKANNPILPIIMISGHGNIETAVQTIKLGAYDFIEKPFKAEKLLIMVERAMELFSLAQENKELKNSSHIFSEISGESKIIKEIVEQTKLIAPTNSRVLISGESGTGKTVLARMLHSLSHRKNKPFMTLYCANLSEDSFEEELFGIDDGNKSHIGLLEKVNGGSLLIKEVTEMPHNVQAKFLKVVQENQFQKVGGNKLIHIDIRFITSTSKDIEREMKSENFNQSLYFRLNVISIHLPLLIERKEDIKYLFSIFNSHISNIYAIPELKLSQEALIALQLYEWPGNVRQLKNVIEWLLIMYGKPGKIIDRCDLPHEITETNSVRKINLLSSDIILKPLKSARNAFEKEYLKTQLGRFSGNISKTANQIGMERTALHKKLKLLGLIE